MHLRYGLEEKPNHWESAIYGMQWAAVIFSSNIFLLLLTAQALGLSVVLTAQFIQRSLIFIGASCLLQLYLGHRLSIYEVVASFWLSTFIFISYAQQAQGISMDVVLGKLVFLQIATGLIMIVLTFTGIATKIKRFFSPTVMGVTLIMISIQMSSSMVPGMMRGQNGTADIRLALFSTALFIFSIYIGFRKGRLQPYIGLIGLGGGWLFYRLLGLPVQQMVRVPNIVLPQFFAFGLPVVDLSLLPIAFFIVMIYLSNEIASVNAAGDVLGVKITERTIHRTSYAAGISHILAVAFSSIPVVPGAMGAGMVATTGVGSRRPMAIGSVILLLLGLVGPLGSFLATIPPAVSYSVSLSIIARIMYMGFKNCFAMGMNEKNISIASIAILFGAGIIFLPRDFFTQWGFASSILGNGLFMSVLLTLFLENLLLKNIDSDADKGTKRSK